MSWCSAAGQSWCESRPAALYWPYTEPSQLRKSVIQKVTRKFEVRSDRGRVRFIVCSEEQIEKSDPHFQYKYYVPSGHKSYAFEDGGPAAKIGDTFLDRTGEIYRASQSV